ncbi:MAG: carboxypeptidase-like regulatory domain-containing protein [Acidobacteriota bacterium]
MKQARPLAALIFLTASTHAAVLHGVALENQTSRPLARARARVQLYRLEGNQLKSTTTVIASRSGQFVFRDLTAGYYQIGATRPGFAEARYGQRRNNGSGAPILLDRDASQFIELRLKRLGAVTGRVTDENGVGLAGIPVSAYTSGPLMRLVSTATSDDRGIYRVTGLLPGRHVIRTGGARLEDGLNLLPTYHPYTSTFLRDARVVFADLDADTPDIDIQPVSGRLATLTVKVQTCIGAAQVTLSSDTGRRQAIALCNIGPIVFENLAPGEYEVLAEGQSDRQPVAAFQSFVLDNNREIGLSLLGLPDLALRLEGAAGLTLRDIGLTVRRRDVAGFGPELTVDAARASLPPGLWQIAVLPPASHYVSDIKTELGGYRRSTREAHPDWFELYLDGGYVRAVITLSAQPAQLTGRVLLSGQPAIAAPVYLLPSTQPTRRRMNGLHVAYADTNGNYSFSGLAPGNYLFLSSFDISEVTEETMAAAQARTITLDEGRTLNQDLDLSQLSR